MSGDPAVSRSRTHCRAGHEYTPENTRWKEGARVCRLCSRLHRRRAVVSVRTETQPGAPLSAIPTERQGVIRERLLARVESEPNSGCWLWLGTLHNRQGYGMVWLAWLGRKQLAHRLAYLAWKGPITPPLQVDHRCNNPRCINPDHLRLVTSRENTLRGNSPSAQSARKTHCPQGHPYSPENTLILSTGYRYCRICYRAKELRKRPLGNARARERRANARATA